MLLLLNERHVALHTVGQLAAGKQHAVTASLALQPDVCPKSDDLPVVTAAWMWFAEFDVITKRNFRQHVGIITHVIISKLMVMARVSRR